ncbi:MAG TPA: YhbY family RNA-binding protein [Rectinemataceae bacterium]|nr:YhbY family RNA-binding protein [Rectinemataceae bacterium]
MLTSRQRSRLSGLAQTRSPLISLGRAGASEALVARLGTLLDQHELVKLRFGDFRESRRDLAAQLAARSSSELVTLIGNVAVFWRQNPDPEKRRIELGD